MVVYHINLMLSSVFLYSFLHLQSERKLYIMKLVMNMKRLFAFICILILVISLSACGNSLSNQINVGIGTKPKTFDPQLASNESELLIVRNIFEGLMRINSEGNVECAAAESYKKDKNTYTFTLRDDLMWSDETPLTAYDFEFAFQRAVNPRTAAPNSSYLDAIKGAKEILASQKNVSALGVKAIDKKTLTITLVAEDDGSFLSLLTNAIFMPCNKEFFEECSGKYGRDSESVIANGSYKIRSWNLDANIIKLSKNANYAGVFPTNTNYVVLKYKTISERIEDLHSTAIDLTMVDTGYVSQLSEEFNLKKFDNTSYVLLIGKHIPENIRTSLVGSASIYNSLTGVTSLSYSGTIYPKITIDGLNLSGVGVPKLDDQKAHSIFSSEVKSNYKGKLPTYTVYYNDTGALKTSVTAVAAHWQSALGANINICSTDDQSGVYSAILTGDADIAVVPLTVSENNPYQAINLLDKYSAFIGLETKQLNKLSALAENNPSGDNLSKIQKQLLQSNALLPYASSCEVVAYSKNLTLPIIEFENGMIDFAFAIKYLS